MTMKSTLRLAFALTWSHALCVASAQAQLFGTVRDSVTHAPVEGAVVTVRALGLKTITNSHGQFSFDAADRSVKKDARIAAAAVGYYIASTRLADVPEADAGVEMRVEKVPEPAASPDWEFPSPYRCVDCHQWIYESWRNSQMAHAGINTWALDLYSGDGTPGGSGGFVYKRDSKLAHTNQSSECAACHQPELWIKEPGSAMVNEPKLPAVADGVSCLVCHRIASVDVSKINFPGLQSEAVKFLAPVPGHIVQFGPLPDVTFANASMRPAYQPQISAEVCGACHQDKNDPDGDGDFEEDDGVISEPTYLEWAASSYAEEGSDNFKTCADCHMEVSKEDSACDQVKPDPPRSLGELRKHTFEGTTAKFLENAVTMSMKTRVSGRKLEVEISIENDKTGHHVPTGVTIRNMILLVEATRSSDRRALKHTGQQVIHELGGLGDPKNGYFAGLPGKMFAKINNDDDGTSPVFYTEAAGIVSDTRIPAGATDVSRYTFAMPGDHNETVEVRARLIYRRSWRAVVDAKQWTEDGHGKPLEDIAPPYFGHLMAEQVEQLGGKSDADCTAPGCTEPDSKGANGGCGVVRAKDERFSLPIAALAWALLIAARLRRARGWPC